MPTNLRSVVFICTGNFYRSRFSEYLFNALAKKSGLQWRATSRGLRTWVVGEQEGPISEFAAYSLTALDVPFDMARFPSQLLEIDLEDADLVIALKKVEHHEIMVEQFPVWADRITYWNVDDLDCATADEALPLCKARIEALVDKLLAEQKQREAPARLKRAA